MSTRVLADANVLFSRTLRDWLIMIQLEGGPYTLYWSEDILAEVIYRLRRKFPQASGGSLTQIRDRITGSLEGGRVEDFVVDGSFAGTDVNDQHVHAAAVACHAHIVLTQDSGFTPPGAADELPYEVQQPDEFLMLVDDSAPLVVAAVAVQQAKYFVARRGSADLCAALRAAGCPRFSVRVYQHLSREL